MSMPVTLPLIAKPASKRLAQPDPHPTSSTRALVGTRMRSIACSPTGRWPRSILSPFPSRAHSLNSVRSCSCPSLVIAYGYFRRIVPDVLLWIWKDLALLQTEPVSAKRKNKSGEFIRRVLSHARIRVRMGIMSWHKRYSVKATYAEHLQGEPRLH